MPIKKVPKKFGTFFIFFLANYFIIKFAYYARLFLIATYAVGFLKVNLK